MNVLYILLKVLGIILVFFILLMGIIFCYLCIKRIHDNVKLEINSGGIKGWCNDCEISFLEEASRIDNWKFIYCPHCGKELTLHRDHPEYKNNSISVALRTNEKTTFCFDCDKEYTFSKQDESFLFCPFCGKQTYGFDNESFKRFEKDYLEYNESDNNNNE